MGEFEVVVGAGSLRSAGDGAVTLPHRWTADGVSVRTEFTGAHLLHLSAAGCVLNDLYREAVALGIELAGVRVTASGGFDPADWSSTGIRYAVELDSAAPAAALTRLLQQVDEVAEIPRTLRAGAPVHRVDLGG
ncbi:OsmC family protein [Kitasatospora sp. NPDC058965]|uniref:OsmC family protein n=1 Tax=Kitasatospora sp. NPDC058965 TaxID=3346682 RepID=UPI0036C424EF